jgi:hypothetical protein
MIIKKRPSLFWAGFLLNIMPLSLCLLGVMNVDLAASIMEAVWIPSIVLIIVSFDAQPIILLAVIKAMMLGIGEKVYPIYIVGIESNATLAMGCLAIALIFSIIGYIQCRFSEPCKLS